MIKSMEDSDEKKDLITKISDLARDLNATRISRPVFIQKTGVSERKILKLFGSYNAFVEAAGLETTIFPKSDTPIYSDQELLSEIVRVLRLPDAKLTRIFFEQNAAVSASVCERRFGGWINTLKTVVDRLDADSEKALIEKIKEYTASSPTPIQSAKNIESDNESYSEFIPQTGSEEHQATQFFHLTHRIFTAIL